MACASRCPPASGGRPTRQQDQQMWPACCGSGRGGADSPRTSRRPGRRCCCRTRPRSWRRWLVCLYHGRTSSTPAFVAATTPPGCCSPVGYRNRRFRHPNASGTAGQTGRGWRGPMRRGAVRSIGARRIDGGGGRRATGTGVEALRRHPASGVGRQSVTVPVLSFGSSPPPLSLKPRLGRTLRRLFRAASVAPPPFPQASASSASRPDGLHRMRYLPGGATPTIPDVLVCVHG